MRKNLQFKMSILNNTFRKNLHLSATTNEVEAYKDAEMIIIAAPTDYDTHKNFFDTSAVEQVIENIISMNNEALIVIKSTVPVGYTESIREKYGKKNILFSPEFLREANGLYDNLYPNRIIVGTDLNDGALVSKAHEFVSLLQEGALKENIDTLIMGFSEAEAVKLFSNAYLALRVSYFNELDTYAELKGLNTKAIIDGVGLILELVSFITIHPLVMVVTVYQRIVSNCCQIIMMFLKILFQQLFLVMKLVKNLLQNVFLK